MSCRKHEYREITSPLRRIIDVSCMYLMIMASLQKYLAIAWICMVNKIAICAAYFIIVAADQQEIVR